MKKTAAKVPAKAGPLSTIQAANLVLLSRARLYELTETGAIKRLAPNRYDITDVVHGYIKFLRDERRGTKTATLSAVQAARAREIELRIAREEHQLIDLEEALGVLDEIVGGMKADFDGVAASVTRDPALRQIIESKVDEIFKRYSDGLDQKAHALRKSGAVAEADSEDDA
jgi:hypothetical protein